MASLIKKNFLPLSSTGNPLINNPEFNHLISTSAFSFNVGCQLNKTAGLLSNKPTGLFLWVFASSQYYVRVHAKGLNSNAISDLGKPSGLQLGDLHQLGVLLSIIPHWEESKTPLFNNIQFDSRVLLPVLDPVLVNAERQRLKAEKGVTNEQEFTLLNDSMQKEIVIRFVIGTIPTPNSQRLACCDIALFDLLQTGKMNIERNYHIKDSVAQLSQILTRGSTPMQNDMRVWPLTKKLDPTSGKVGLLFVHQTNHIHVPTFAQIMSRHTLVFKPMVMIDMLNKHQYAVRDGSSSAGNNNNNNTTTPGSTTTTPPTEPLQRDLNVLYSVMNQFLQFCYVPRIAHPAALVEDLLKPIYDQHIDTVLPILQAPAMEDDTLLLTQQAQHMAQYDKTKLINPIHQLQHNKQFIDQHFKRYPLSSNQNLFTSVQPSGIPLFFSHVTVPHTHIPPTVHAVYEGIVGEHREMIPNLYKTAHPHLFTTTGNLCSGILAENEIASPGVDLRMMYPERPILDVVSTQQHGLTYHALHYDIRLWLYGEYFKHIKHLESTGQEAEIPNIPPPVDYPPDLGSLLNVIHCALQILKPSDQEPTTVVDPDLMIGTDPETGEPNISTAYYHGMNMAHFLAHEVLYRSLMQMKDDIQNGVIQYYVVFLLSYRVDCLLNTALSSLLSALPISIVLVASDNRDAKSQDLINMYRLDPLWPRMDMNLNTVFGLKSQSPGAYPNDPYTSELSIPGYKRQQRFNEGLFKDEPTQFNKHLYSKIIGHSAYLQTDVRNEIDNEVDPTTVYTNQVKGVSVNTTNHNPFGHTLGTSVTSGNIHNSSSQIFTTNPLNQITLTNNIKDNNGNLTGIARFPASESYLNESNLHEEDLSTALNKTLTANNDKKGKKEAKYKDEHEDEDLTSYEKRVREEKVQLFRTTAFRDHEDNIYGSLIKSTQGAQRNVFILYIDSYCFEGAKQRYPNLTPEVFEDQKQKEICDYLQQRITLQVKEWFNIQYRTIDLYHQYTLLSSKYNEQFTPSRPQLQQQQQYQQSLTTINNLPINGITTQQSSNVNTNNNSLNNTNNTSLNTLPNTSSNNNNITPLMLNSPPPLGTSGSLTNHRQSPRAGPPGMNTFMSSTGSNSGTGPIISLSQLQKERQAFIKSGGNESGSFKPFPSPAASLQKQESTSNFTPPILTPQTSSHVTGGGGSAVKEKKGGLFSKAKLQLLKKEKEEEPPAIPALPQTPSNQSTTISTTATTTTPHQFTTKEVLITSPSTFTTTRNNNNPENSNNDDLSSNNTTAQPGQQILLMPDESATYSDEEDDSDEEKDNNNNNNTTIPNKDITTPLQKPLPTLTLSTPPVKPLLSAVLSTPVQQSSLPNSPPVIPGRPPVPQRMVPALPPKLHPLTARLDQTLLTPQHIICGFDNMLSANIKSQHPERICTSCQTSDHSLYNYHSLWVNAQQKAQQLAVQDDEKWNTWIQRKIQENEQMQQQQQQP